MRRGQLGGLALRHQGPDLALHLGEGGLLLGFGALGRLLRRRRLGERVLGLALGRLQLALLRGQMGLGHIQRVDGTGDVAARHRLVLAGDGGLFAPGAEQRLDVAVARARHVRGHRLLAQGRNVRGDMGQVVGDVRLDLGDLPVDLRHLLLGGVVLLGGGVEPLLVGCELRGDLRSLRLGAGQGVGDGLARRGGEHARQDCDDSSGHQGGAAGPPRLLA
jgi:hypothetical protein